MGAPGALWGSAWVPGALLEASWRLPGAVPGSGLPRSKAGTPSGRCWRTRIGGRRPAAKIGAWGPRACGLGGPWILGALGLGGLGPWEPGGIVRKRTITDLTDLAHIGSLWRKLGRFRANSVDFVCFRNVWSYIPFHDILLCAVPRRRGPASRTSRSSTSRPTARSSSAWC